MQRSLKKTEESLPCVSPVLTPNAIPNILIPEANTIVEGLREAKWKLQ